MLQPEVFQTGIAAILVTFHSIPEPDKESGKFWYEMLKDIPDQVFMRTCKQVCKMKRRPDNIPAEILDIAEQLSGKLSADEAYAIIEDTVEGYLGAGMSGETCKTAIKHSLESHGYSELVGLAFSWGVEIWQNSNPTATRAQFRNSFEKETHLIDEKRKQIRRGDTKTIEGSLHQIFEDVEDRLADGKDDAEKGERK